MNPFLNNLGGINLYPGHPEIVDNDNSLEFRVYFVIAGETELTIHEWKSMTNSCLLETGLYHRLGNVNSLISHDTLVGLLTGSVLFKTKNVAWDIYNFMVKHGFDYKNYPEESGYRANHTRQPFFMGHLYTCCGIKPPLWDQVLWSVSILGDVLFPNGRSGLLLSVSVNEAYKASEFTTEIMGVASLIFDLVLMFKFKNVWNVLYEYFSEIEIKNFCLGKSLEA